MASPDDRPPLALAVEWVSRITTVSLEMVVPGVVGYWLDHRWQTHFLAPLGFVFGVVAGMWHLLRMTASSGSRVSGSKKSRLQEGDQSAQNSTQDPQA